MRREKHKLRKLSALVMLNLGLSIAYVSAAETAANTENSEKEEAAKEEKIVVVGIRGSLEQSLDRKREAKTFLDAITAEDIGKFPDQNVAESLQRIAGVAIDREGGEGQLVSVRGLGSEFNTTLLNGRSLASISGGRGFSFDVIASELISGAQVHKTQSASMVEGASGATINLESFQPLDIDGFKAVGSVKYLHDDMTSTTKPQISGLISNTFADNKVGVLFSFSRTDREYRSDQAQNGGFYKTDLSFEDPNNPGQMIEMADVTMPRNYDQIAKQETRERIGGTFVLQYKPTEDMTLTADYLTSKYDVKYSENTLAHWFDTDWISGASLDANRTAVKLDFLGDRGGKTDYLNRESTRPTETKLYGINMEWNATNTLQLTADFYRSTAVSDNFDGWTDTVAGVRNDYSYDHSTGAALPTLTFKEQLDKNNLLGGWGERGGSYISDEISDAKINGEWDVNWGPLVSISFGVANSDRELNTKNGSTPWPLVCLLGCFGNVTMPSSMFSLYNADGFLSAVNGNPVQQWLTFSSAEFFKFAGSEAAISQFSEEDQVWIREAIAANPNFTAEERTWNNNFIVQEEVTSFYTDFFFEQENWSALLGLRYLNNKTTGIGTQWYLTNLVPSANDPDQLGGVYSDDTLPINLKSDYKKLLPSLNLKFDIADDWVTRFAYSKSMTRPDIGKMSPRTSYNDGNIDDLTGSGGNPGLKPYESKNYDLGLEWYYNPGSYASIAYYEKRIDGYIENEEQQETLTLPSGTYNYTITRPFNVNSAKITGQELIIQHMFDSLPAPFNGLGVILNMTFVDGKSSKDEPNKPFQVGLGDSQNLVLFYEQEDFQARIAYNNRDEFFQYWRGSSYQHPVYVKDYAQIDVSASYDVNENFQVFFEGINVTNETYDKRATFENQMMSITETGARYAIGARFSF